MNKSYFLPIGYMVDTDNISHHVDSIHYPIISLVMFDLEKAELVPIKMEEVPSNNAFKFSRSYTYKNDLVFEIIDFIRFGEPTVHCGSSYFKIGYECLPVYNKDMELIKIYGRSYDNIAMDKHLVLNVTFNPVFDYKVCYRRLTAVNMFAMVSDITKLEYFFPLFNKVLDGIYENYGVVIITDDIKSKSLIVPEEAKCIRITTKFKKFDEIVFNKKFNRLDTTGSSIFRYINKIYISKDSSKRQLSQIIESIRSSISIGSEKLDELFDEEKFDGYYDYLLRNDDLARKILDGIEVVVY